MMGDKKVIFPGDWDDLRDQRSWERWRDDLLVGAAKLPFPVADRIMRDSQELQKQDFKFEFPDTMTEANIAALDAQFQKHAFGIFFQWAGRHYMYLHEAGMLK